MHEHPTSFQVANQGYLNWILYWTLDPRSPNKVVMTKIKTVGLLQAMQAVAF